MRKLTTPSTLTDRQIWDSYHPIRVRSEGMNLFDVSIGKFKSESDVEKYGADHCCYVVRRLNSGVEFRSKTLSEAKQFIGCFL